MGEGAISTWMVALYLQYSSGSTTKLKRCTLLSKMNHIGEKKLKQVNELIKSKENQSFCFWWFHSLLFLKLIFFKIAWLPSLAILVITSLPFNQEDFFILRMQQSFHFWYIGIKDNSKYPLEENSSFTFLHTITSNKFHIPSKNF